MHILATTFKNHIAVYLLIAFLTMGSYTTASANETALYDILVAEIAASRDMKQVALQYYLKAIKQTNDPAVAESSTLLAITLEAPDEALISAKLWAAEDPKNLQAQMVTMTLLISQSVDAALPYLTKIITLDPNQNEHELLEVQSRLSERSAKNLKEALDQIAVSRPKDPYAHLIAAESAVEQRDIRSASRWVDSALKQMPDFARAIELKARLIRFQKNSDAPAIRFVKTQLDNFPHNKELRFFYASILLDNEKTAEAKLELEKLTEDPKYGGSALLVLADLYLKEKNFSEALKALKKAKSFEDTADGAEYLLGEKDELQGNYNAAIEHYSNVNKGPYQIAAVLRAVGLLNEAKAYKEAINLLHNSSPTTFEEQKRFLLLEIDLLNASKNSEEALQLANEILVKIPDDEDVLYSRAITETKLKKWDLAEMDLKQILKKNPNNANALNALGYVVSYNTKRLNEALDYITEALSIAPTNPAFMDTLGWTYYRIGNLKQSVRYLKMAFEISENPKTAAHLGEALWMNNQKDEAKTIWKKALADHKEDEELLDTITRFKVNLKN